jgi:hypothetical protein
MPPTSPSDKLLDLLQGLFQLNPELGDQLAERLYELAPQADAARFDHFASLAEQLLESYLTSPWKKAERRTLGEYFASLERSSRLLAQRGDIGECAPLAASQPHSVALVTPHLYTSLDWYRLIGATEIPPEMIKAVDACTRRNSLLTSVMEPMFRVLHLIDHNQAMHWELQYLEAHRQAVDPDVARDLLRAWLEQPSLSPELLAWPLAWSTDASLARQWPTVIHESDRLLRRHALAAWAQQQNPRHSLLLNLQRWVSHHRHDEHFYSRWLNTALIALGESVAFFANLGRADSPEAGTASWKSAALMRELNSLTQLVTPILLLADLLLVAPDGATRFAKAFFGFSGPGGDAWQQKIQTQAERVIRRIFLNALRRRTPPAEVIHRFCFHDEELFEQLVGELDLVTKQFDSLAQREIVIRRLAVYYASFRENTLMAKEVTHRYRQLMSMLHEDHLRLVLDPEQFAEFAGANVLRDLSALSADTRRYLSRRRDLSNSLEELLAAEMDFSHSIRQRRHRFIRTLLG